MLSSQIVYLGLGGFVLGSQLLHDLAHAFYFLLQRRIVALDKEHFLFFLALFCNQLLFLFLLLSQLLLQNSFLSNLFFLSLINVVDSVAAHDKFLLHFFDELVE